MVITLTCSCGVNMPHLIRHSIAVHTYNKTVFNLSFNHIHANRYFYSESVCEVNTLRIRSRSCKFFEVYGLFSHPNWCSLDFMALNLQIAFCGRAILRV